MSIVFGSAEAQAIIEAEPELLPCPFCGGKPEMSPPRRSASGNGVECEQYIYCPDCQVYAEEGSRDVIVAHWNGRVQP